MFLSDRKIHSLRCIKDKEPDRLSIVPGDKSCNDLDKELSLDYKLERTEHLLRLKVSEFGDEL